MLIQRYHKISKLVGQTPLVRISDNIFAKLETYNPSGSVKDRMISFLVGKALERDEITKDTVLVEATSGNTGIALSMFGSALGLSTIIIMPSNMSPERKQMMRSYGAKIIDVPPSDFKSAIELRTKMCESDSTFWSPMQFENQENIECHRTLTGPEIASQISKHGEWSAFISGAGTGGTLSGVQKYISDTGLQTKSILMKPLEDSANHGIQGVNDGGDFLLNKSSIDLEISVSTSEAIDRATRLAKETGLLVGISSGANIVAAENYVADMRVTGNVVTMLCDRGERYLSIFNKHGNPV